MTINAKTLPSLQEGNISKKNSSHKVSLKEKSQPQKIHQVLKNENKNPTSKEEEEENILYEVLSIDEAKLTTMPRKNIRPIEAIRIQNTHIGTLQVNDTLTLPNIEGIDYTLTISSTQTHNDGSVTTTGKFEDEGISYTTTITMSNKSSFMTLSTPKGLYEIETQDDTGYIYKTSDIRRHLQKTDKDDFIVLPVPSKPALQ